MEKVFNAELTMDYQNINGDLTVSLPGIMGYIQETSLLHSKKCGYTMEYFQDIKKAFVLINWQVEIKRFPNWNEKVVISTWPSEFKGITAKRSFLVKSLTGEVLVNADSKWIYTDIVKKKPIKIEEDMMVDFAPLCKRLMDQEENINESTLGYTILKKEEIYAKRSHIDSNSHVNNITYIKWAIDNMPDELYDSNKLHQLTIKYKKECTLNQGVLIETYVNNENNKEILTIMKSLKESEVIYCISKSQWIENN